MQVGFGADVLGHPQQGLVASAFFVWQCFMEATEGRNGSGSKAILSYTVMYSEYHFWGYGDPFIGVNSRGTEL